MTGGSGPTRTFTILFVCSGNICRSPLAAQLLRTELGPDADLVDIRSAGTVAIDGAAMDAAAAEQSRNRGGDPKGHEATLLRPSLLAVADLVLTADRSHRASVVEMLPRASRRTFTIRQFARILAGLEAGDLSAVDGLVALVETVGRLRGSVAPPADPAEDDVEDPYRQDVAVHVRAADAVAAAIGPIAAALRTVLAQTEAASS